MAPLLIQSERRTTTPTDHSIVADLSRPRPTDRTSLTHPTQTHGRQNDRTHAQTLAARHPLLVYPLPEIAPPSSISLSPLSLSPSSSARSQTLAAAMVSLSLSPANPSHCSPAPEPDPPRPRAADPFPPPLSDSTAATNPSHPAPASPSLEAPNQSHIAHFPSSHAMRATNDVRPCASLISPSTEDRIRPRLRARARPLSSSPPRSFRSVWICLVV